jgi:hypothetical protein
MRLFVPSTLVASLLVVGCATGTSDQLVTANPDAQFQDSASGGQAGQGADASQDAAADTQGDQLSEASIDVSSPDGTAQDASGDSTLVEAASDVASDIASDSVSEPWEAAVADSNAPDAVDASVCAMPPEACSMGSGSGVDCANALVLPRQASTVTVNGQLVAADGEDVTPSCADSGADRSYRLFMQKGETAQLRLWELVNGFNAVLVVQQPSQACTGTTCDTEVGCKNAYTGSGSVLAEPIDFTATQTGWITIVADSRITPMYSYRFFTLEVTLSCTGTCGC